MPFDIRCPDCRAKLRLDAKPDRDAPIECPKCGSTFTPADAAAADKATGKTAPDPKPKKSKKSKNPQEAAAGAPVGDKAPKEDREREFFNPFALLGIIVACLAVYVTICWFVLFLLGKSGKVEDMVAFIPKECNTVRGANLSILNRYPGYKEEMVKYAIPSVKTALDELAKANGQPPETFLDYMIYGRQRDATSTAMTVFTFRSKEDVNPAAVKTALKATDQQIGGGKPCLRMPPDAPGLLAGALVAFPTNRHVVIAPSIGNTDQSQAINLSMAGAADRSKSFVNDLGDTGRVVIRGHGWLLLKPTGANQPTILSLSDPLTKDLPVFVEKLKATKLIGLWNSFGGSVRFGGAIECDSPSGAAALAKALREGEMGKGDDAEIPRGFRSVFYSWNSKEFKALMSNFSFKSSGSSGYYTSSLSGEPAKQMLQTFGLPTKVDGGSSGGQGSP